MLSNSAVLKSSSRGNPDLSAVRTGGEKGRGEKESIPVLLSGRFARRLAKCDSFARLGDRGGKRSRKGDRGFAGWPIFSTRV